MPEARDRTEGVGQLGIHPTALIVRSAVSRGRVIRSPSDDKENVTPVGVVRRTRRRSGEWKSPLPVWYPRTPLRDITAVVNLN
ncbi:hypothetical protein QJS10_CPA10g00128 [Acorus calamus]|uniref:Uncharacterized protein n=1 Tax=Acorus calamus TaxID=4465 RepID=A0AAV9DZN3_ACOCL|nr:hypothetical protein QJS10_CPA10g00128 [Acorus calamus]